MAREAAAAGISRSVVDSAFAGLTPDGAVLAFDRRQRGTFRKSFEEYASTRVIPARIKRAKQLRQRHAALLARIERQFGVPATLLMAIWTLESDNGTGDMGKLPVIRTLATLAARLPPQRAIPGRASRRVTDRPARRSSLARPDRCLRGRDRPDAVSAILVREIWRRL
jgi:membrane-bound lytic murein transglycosylase B